MTTSLNATWISTTPAQPWLQKKPNLAADGRPNLELSGDVHQAWEGFGGCFNELGWLALSGVGEPARRQALDALFAADGCRFTRCRMPIGASDYGAEWYSLNETDGDFAMAHFSIERDRRILIPYIKAAQKIQPRLELFASPWSPPTWMKFPKAYNHGTFIWKREYLDAYALYLLKVVQAYRAEGIPIVQIHVQNEPLADQKFPSCVWTGPQLRDFIRDHLGPLFAHHKETCEIWLGTLNTDDYDNYPHLVLADPQAAVHISGVGLQWAGKGMIQRIAQSWPDIRLMQTENECGDGRNTWEYAHAIFGLFRHYIDNGACGYIYWNMVLQPGGRSTWGWPQNAMITADPQAGTITFNPEFYVMKHFSRYIAPNAVRLGLRRQWTSNAVAFRNADRTTVLVVQNPFDEPRELAIGGLSGMLTAQMDARSFNTFVVEGGEE